ncbi:MAG: PEP-utilizing enzyme, partial [Pseudomonadota bacterium]
CDDVPGLLGPPPEPAPPQDIFPVYARPAQAGFDAANGNVFDPPPPEGGERETVSGFPVSPGVYEGVARLIKTPDDFHRIQQGDVLVTKSTSASFNVVLPLVGAVVTDRGGQLSHAAIVAREYGVPGIVGARTASATIPDGARVRVDGAKGTVELL